jgi:hypothetical protein
METLKTFITALLLTVLFTSCGGDTDTNSDTKISPLVTPTKPETSPGNEKLEPFNNIDDTRAKLSGVGIGQLGDWKEDGMGGYMSITTYYRFGDVSSSTGMNNNLAFYLESDNPNSIKSLKLILNINNQSQKKQALTKFRDIADKTFRQLAADAPQGLLAAIQAPKAFKADNEIFSTELKLDKSKIDTWKLTISSK